MQSDIMSIKFYSTSVARFADFLVLCHVNTVSIYVAQLSTEHQFFYESASTTCSSTNSSCTIGIA